MSESPTSENESPRPSTSGSDTESIQANYFVEGTSQAGDDSIPTTPSATAENVESSNSDDHSLVNTAAELHIHHHYHGPINTNVLSTGPNAYIDKSGATNIVGAVTSEERQEPDIDRTETVAEDPVGTKYAVGGTTDSRDESPSTSAQSLGDEIHRDPVGTKSSVGGTTDSKDESPSTSVQSLGDEIHRDPVGTKSAVGGTTDSKDESPSTSVQSLGEEIHRGSIQANDIVKSEGDDAEELARSTPSTSTQRPERRNSTGPSSDNAAGATSIHYHVDVAHITGNIVALGDNSYIEQSGTNVVGTVGSGPREEKERDKKLTKEKVLTVCPGEREESGKNFEQAKKIEKKEEPVKKVVVIPGGPYTSGGSSLHRFFRAGAFAQKFREIVNKRSYKQALGGITDTFKEQNLHEPGFEANPRMKKLTHFYSGELAPKTSDYTKEPILNVSTGSAEESDFISPEELIDLISNGNSKYIAIAGKAGSGKTTLIRRLTRDIISINKLDKKATFGGFFTGIFSKFSPRFKMVHFLNVKDIEDGTKPMTPRELLFDRVFPDMNENELRYGYDRMVNNQNEVLLVFDGLDQAQWIIQESYPKVNHMDQASTAATMTSILSGHLFPDVQIIISSREHSLSPLTGKLRPNCIVAMMGLKLEDIEKVFNAVLSYDGKTTDEFISLNPAILPLCSIPLFLMYCAVIRRIYPQNLPSTMTEVMKLIIQIFMRFEHARQSYDSEIINSLKHVSFIAHLEKRVTFTIVELEKHGLPLKMINDFMINVPGSPMLNQKLFDGDFRAFFSHQILQEKFTAMYVCDKEIEDFRSFAWEKLRQPHWSVVRRFVCGMLAHTQDHELEFFKINQKTEKCAIFKEILLHQAENVEDSLDRPELFALLYESQDEDLIQSTIREIDFVGETFTPALMHSMSSVMRCCRHLNLFRLGNCDLNKEVFDIFERTTRDCHLTVDTVKIENNSGLTFQELGRFLNRFESQLHSVDWHGAYDRADNPSLAALKIAKNDVVVVLASPPDTYDSQHDQFLSEVEEIAKLITKPGEVQQQSKSGIPRPSVAHCHLKAGQIENNKVQRLDVSDDRKVRQNNGWIAFVLAVAQWKPEEVSMRSYHLIKDDVEKLMEGVGDAKIRMMDVSDNFTLRKNRGFAAFGSVAKQCTVQEVSMRICGLKRDDVEGFLKGAENSKIRRLDLSRNALEYGQGGFTSVGSVVAQCGVQELIYKRNRLTAKLLRDFQSTAGNVVIRLIDLSDNWHPKLEKEEFNEILRIVQRNKVETLVMKKCLCDRVEFESFKKSIPTAVDFQYSFQ